MNDARQSREGFTSKLNGNDPHLAKPDLSNLAVLEVVFLFAYP